MAIKIVGASNNHASVDADPAALEVTGRPDQTLNWQSTTGVSGNVATVAANGPLCSLRNTGPNLIIVRRLSMSFRVSTGFTAGQELRFAVFRAFNYTSGDTGGTEIFSSALQNRHSTNLAPVAFAPDIRVPTTGGLTVGTRTLESIPLGAVHAWTAAATASLVIPITNLLSQDAGDYPVVLAANEGLVMTNQVLMGAGGVGVLVMNVEWAEATAY